MTLTDRLNNPDRRTTDLTPIVERRAPLLSPMARRVTANKHEGVRLVDEVAYAGVRPAGLDRSAA